MRLTFVIGSGLQIFLVACGGGGGAADIPVSSDIHFKGPELPEVPSEEDLAGLDLAGCPDAGCLPPLVEKCIENGDCESGWCVEHMGDGVCSTPCIEDCPAGWKCKEVTLTWPDVQYVCLSDYANLCRPCRTSDDCKGTGGQLDACLDYGPDGDFCGGDCGEDGVCPPGFECKEVTSTEGLALSQCVVLAGACDCSPKSAADHLATFCQVDSQWGTCTGTRTCEDGGLSPCDALVPLEESCNGLDDDCDGQTDQDPSDSPPLCDDGNPCTDDACTGGQCKSTPNSALCDDGDPCTTGEACGEGGCQPGLAMDCGDDNACTDDSCVEGEDGTAACLNVANALPCDNGGTCVEGICVCLPDCEGKQCGPDGCGGTCLAGPVPCELELGVCEGTVKGEELCQDGLLSPCPPALYFWNDKHFEDGTETSCDLFDNDCDGLVDEDLGSATCGLGQCEKTVQLCKIGVVQTCDPLLGQSPEVCDKIDNDCDGLTDEMLGTSTCGVGMCGHTVENCTNGVLKPCDPFEGATPELLDGIDNDCDGQVDEGFPVAGVVLITELMVNPDCVIDDMGEWIELFNASGTAWDLSGWTLKDEGTNFVEIPPGVPFVIAPGQYRVLGVNPDKMTNGHVVVDFAYSVNKFQLGNAATGDELILTGPGGVIVDKVAWSTAAGFPDASYGKGKSFSLKSSAYNHLANDQGANWVLASTPIPGGCGDFGTPGVANP